MPDTNIIELIVVGLFGAGGVAAWLRAAAKLKETGTEHKKVMAAAEDSAATVAVQCLERISRTYQERLDVVTDRLTALEAQLERERSRAGVLERKVQILEREREEWRKERAALLLRIDELEGKK